MPMRSWDEVPHGTTHQTLDGVELKQMPSGDWRCWIGDSWTKLSIQQEPNTAGKPKAVPKPTPIGTHRGSKQRMMVAVGGPWDGQRVVFPKPSGSPHGLPVRVGAWHGRYNLDTGEWADLKMEAVV